MAENRPQYIGPFFEVQQEVRRMFQELVHQPWGGAHAAARSQWQPCCDMAETDDAIVIEIELPGVQRKEVRVEVEGDVLRISGERRSMVQRRGRHYHRTERQYGSFQRQLRLPHSVDRRAIRARCQAGVLIITLPKKMSG